MKMYVYIYMFILYTHVFKLVAPPKAKGQANVATSTVKHVSMFPAASDTKDH